MLQSNDPHQPPEVRAARIAAVAAIIGAVISGASGIFTYVSTQKQISAEDKRSLSEFQRDQRQKAYAQFIADEHTLDELESDYTSPSFDPNVSDEQQKTRDELRRQIEETFTDKLQVAAGNLRLVASPDAAAFVEDFTNQHREFVRAISARSWLPRTKSQDDALTIARRIDEYEQRLIGVAQADLA